MQVYDFRDRSVREPAMQQSHLKTFHAARQRLVEQRHELIRALAFNCQAEQSEAHIDLIIRVQEAIDIVDKAIDEERPLPQPA